MARISVWAIRHSESQSWLWPHWVWAGTWGVYREDGPSTKRGLWPSREAAVREIQILGWKLGHDLAAGLEIVELPPDAPGERLDLTKGVRGPIRVVELPKQTMTGNLYLDNPEDDGTDAAHPAWWRGQEWGCRGTAERLLETVEGRDNGSGVIAAPEIERVRRKILEFRQRISVLEAKP